MCWHSLCAERLCEHRLRAKGMLAHWICGLNLAWLLNRLSPLITAYRSLWILCWLCVLGRYLLIRLWVLIGTDDMLHIAYLDQWKVIVMRTSLLNCLSELVAGSVNTKSISMHTPRPLTSPRNPFLSLKTASLDQQLIQQHMLGLLSRKNSHNERFEFGESQMQSPTLTAWWARYFPKTLMPHIRR